MEALAAHRENTKIVERLDLEIGYRFCRLQIRLYELSQKDPSLPVPYDGLVALRRLQLTPDDSFYLYPEFSKTSTLGLIAELMRRVQDDKSLF